ncbi:MAG TPA: T9SS type A sorting domain-containing protein, partial [Chitinophagaceae bacterium]|nr:T9SS type A sorting domain-containing protein [Chitinophagaceae bacterium]
DTGTYVVTPGLPLFYTSVKPAIHNVSFGSSFGQQDAANHFALVPSTNIKDLRVYVTNLGPARQGRSTLYQVTYENKGTETISGSIGLTFDNHLSFTSAAPAPDIYTSPVATWNFSNLGPSMTGNIIVECLVSVSAVPNSYLKTYVVANPVTGDFDPGNNIDSVYHLVVASFDPNDKNVIPDGGIGTDFIASRKYLDYTIRFQNTGNDTAFLVVIRDTLQSNLDVASFEMLSASHPYSLRMYKDGIAEWRFSNILLPDSNVNEPRSHGFVRYRIRPKNTLVAGDMVKNKAAIYFDYNAPVITNETQNIVTMVTGMDPGPDPIEAKAFPNPTRSILYLRVEGYFRYWLYDASGKKIGFSDKSYNEAAIDILRLRKGIYFLEIKTKKGRVTKKILVQ